MEPEIAIIVAVDERGGIGKEGQLPWPRIPEDMRRFRDLSMGFPVVMGRRTYESIPTKFRPLPGRENIVITRQNLKLPGCAIAHSVEEALTITAGYTPTRICIAGGGEIYKAALPLTNKLYLTLIKGDFGADTFFPDYSEFNKVLSEESGEADGVKYTFFELAR